MMAARRRDSSAAAFANKPKTENDAIFAKVRKARRPRLNGACCVPDRRTRDGEVASSDVGSTHLGMVSADARVSATASQYSKFKNFVKEQKKRTKSVSKKNEWTQRKSRLQQSW